MHEINELFEKFRELASPKSLKHLHQEFDDFDQHIERYMSQRHHATVVPFYTYKEKDRYSTKVIDENNLMHDVTITRQEYILWEFLCLRDQLFSRISVLFEAFFTKTACEELGRIIFETKRMLPTTDGFVIDFFEDIKRDIITKHKMWQVGGRSQLPFQIPNPKLKWHGDIKQLTTLFKQLLYDKKNDGENYIECEKNDLINFIHENFYQDDHKEFSFDTIQNYFNDKNDNRSNKGPFINGYGNNESRPAKRKRTI